MNSGADLRPLKPLLEAGVKSVAIVGICKNAGKTSLLNHLLSQRGDAEWGVFSTGIDGEEIDTVFRIPKPAVNLGPGIFFCCDTSTLDRQGSAIQILEKLSAGSASRSLWLVKSLIPLQTEITGPHSVVEQVNLLRRMESLGATKILIDGSLDRKSIAMSEAIDAVAVVIGAGFGPIPSILAEISRLDLLNHIPSIDAGDMGQEIFRLLLDSEGIYYRMDGVWKPAGIRSLIGGGQELKAVLGAKPESIYIPGAVTDTVYMSIREALAGSGARLLLRHPECLKLSLAKLEHFLREQEPEALLPFRIRVWVMNSMSVGTQAIDAGEFRDRLRRAFPQLGMTDIRELEP
jgi:hypothetical protein